MRVAKLFSVNSCLSKRFPERSLTFHSNLGRYKETFKCFSLVDYWSRVTEHGYNGNILSPSFVPSLTSILLTSDANLKPVY